MRGGTHCRWPVAEPALDLADDLLAQMRAILRQHVPEHEVRAFGSRATGRAKRWSDLDPAVMTDAPLTYERIGALRDAFEFSELPIRVEVIDAVEAAPMLRDAIDSGHVVIQPARAVAVDR